MRNRSLPAYVCLSLLLGLPAAAAPQAVLSSAATQWWADISAVASDADEGRMTGSPGYMRAADYVISRLKAEGIAPAGSQGYLQPVAFEQQVVDQDASSATLTDAAGATRKLKVGDALLIGAGGEPRPAKVDAPLVFIGYGLHLPDQGYDDFAGLDLKGKIAVVLSGGPDNISAPVKSDARSNRAKELSKLGVLGVISLTTPHQVEIIWTRQKLIARQPGMYLADAKFHDTQDGFFIATADPGQSETFFKDSGHSFAELCALADASKPVPRFDLKLRLQASIAATRQKVTSPNLVGRLEGSDAKLKSEYVVVSAHLDHLGVGEPINGDRIYNGAMDDASGVAAVLDIAHRLKSGPRPRRSILFAIFTAEEKGLLGSHYFAANPTVPKSAIVADLNFDMPLPLWPLKMVYLPGETESTLGADARTVGAAQGIAVVPDPVPDRNVFIRADQYSFVREGVPSLFMKFGFVKDTPQFTIEHDWRANRYHSPSDDLEQPGIFKEDAVKLDAYTAAIALRVANADSRPEWLSTSIFRRAAEAGKP
ncbi:MAG TPA: M28 family metallopeptidase [Rhizomicrobium sp.]|jgi:Zn-dependent M28 family amino/carboxypeptidase|nr:M28 family metallopeptidase [Rhizomicrobium sp.]